MFKWTAAVIFLVKVVYSIYQREKCHENGAYCQKNVVLTATEQKYVDLLMGLKNKNAKQIHL